MGYDVFISYNTADQKIAEAACHFIEQRRLRCFIAPRNITEIDWADNLYAAIESSKAFVIIVSENSNNSREVAKELSLATRISDYIFPFRIDSADLSGRMNYHLAPFHWIDAVTPPLEQRLNELADRVAAVMSGREGNFELGAQSGNRNRDIMRLVGDTVSPRPDFLGRDGELEELHEMLQRNNAVFLTGMGGIGKSEIAKAYACAHQDIYYVQRFATYETDLLHLIASDSAIPVSNLQQASAAGGQGETTEEYFQRKMSILRSVVNENTLLIIDNFDVEDDPHMEQVLSLPCKQIWTSRTDFSIYGYETIKVGPMANAEDLVTLMQKTDKRYTSPEDQAAVREIIELLDHHTLAVSLTAAQMNADRILPRKMLAQLQQHGLKIKTRGSFSRRKGEKAATAYQFIKALFDFSHCSEDACNILRYLACMPLEGVTVDLFMECCGVESFDDIRRLLDLNWVQLDEESDVLSLHMLIREMVWEQLQPDLDNCAPMLNGAMAWAKNAWNKQYEENHLHSSIIFSLLEVFPAPGIEWLDCFEELATFAWIMGRFDLSERCELHLYALCEEHYGAIHKQSGKQALRVAAVYHNQGDYAKARPWYEKGLRVQEAIDPDSLEAYTARQKVARSDAQLERYEDALPAFEKNLDIVKRHFAAFTGEGSALLKMQRHLSSAQKNLAQLYSRIDRGEEALPIAMEAYELSKLDTEEPSLVIYSLITLVCVYQSLGEYEKAIAYAETALEDTIRYHGANRIDALYLHEVIGDLLARQGRFSEACERYTLALVTREKNLPADTAALARLEKKLTCAEEGKAHQIPEIIMWV